MTLQNVEIAILGIIGRGPYSEFSTDATLANDFALLHQCVNFARDEIRINCLIPALLKHATTITTVASQRRYTITDTNFDIPVVVRYTQTDGTETQLKKTDPINLLSKVSSFVAVGTPSYYQIFDATSAGLSYIELFEIPTLAGESVDIDYKPVLTDVSAATDEDVIMKKYYMAVIQIGAAYAFQMIIKDMLQSDKWILVGRGHFKSINLREIGFDNDPTTKTDNFLSKKRSGRFTK